MKTKIIISFLIVFLLMGCNIIKQKGAEQKSSKNKDDIKVVTVYTDENKNDYQVFIRYNEFKNLYFKNQLKRGHADYDSKMYRTEIQYMIINNKNNELFYISTTPSRYIINKIDSSYTIKNKGNSYFFNGFFIGKIIGNEIIFKNNREKMIWKFDRKHKDTLDINTIINYKIRNNETIHRSTCLIAEIFGEDFKFVKFTDFDGFTYLEKTALDNIAKNSTEVLKNENNIILEKISYLTGNNKAKKILLYYNKPINENGIIRISYKKGLIRFVGDMKK